MNYLFRLINILFPKPRLCIIYENINIETKSSVKVELLNDRSKWWRANKSIAFMQIWIIKINRFMITVNRPVFWPVKMPSNRVFHQKFLRKVFQTRFFFISFFIMTKRFFKRFFSEFSVLYFITNKYCKSLFSKKALFKWIFLGEFFLQLFFSSILLDVLFSDANSNLVAIQMPLDKMSIYTFFHRCASQYGPKSRNLHHYTIYLCY